MSVNRETTHAEPSDSLLNAGYLSLLVTQFLGAANDNLLKQLMVFMVATGIWAGRLGAGGAAVPMLCLTVPFIFLSGVAGQLADRFSKRTVILVVKIAEVPIVLLATLGLWTQNLWLSLAALLLLAVQSSFFGPAKFGVVPELVVSQRLSQANGILNLLSNLAVILGSMLAGVLSVMYNPNPDEPVWGIESPILWAPGIVLLAVAVAGLLAALRMPQLPAANPELPLRPTLFGPYLRSFAEMTPALLTVTIAWSGFYMIGMMALAILPTYKDVLAINDIWTSMLMVMLGVSVALGSLLAGFLSGRQIRPKLIPCGAIGMALSFLVLGAATPTYPLVSVCVSLAGFSAGFYIVPLQALLQYLSPPADRGRFLGTAGALSFVMASLGAIVFWALTDLAQLPAPRVFLACGGLAVVGSAVGIVQMARLLQRSAAGTGEASGVGVPPAVADSAETSG